jgi:hypothetical protein
MYHLGLDNVPVSDHKSTETVHPFSTIIITTTITITTTNYLNNGAEQTHEMLCTQNILQRMIKFNTIFV